MSFCQNCGALLSETNAPCAICAGHSQATNAAVAAAPPASAGMDSNVAGALAYLAGFVSHHKLRQQLRCSQYIPKERSSR